MDHFWKIEEAVTPAGHYIILPPTFGVADEQQAAEAARKYPNARAVLYRTGLYSDGPVRVSPVLVARLSPPEDS